MLSALAGDLCSMPEALLAAECLLMHVSWKVLTQKGYYENKTRSITQNLFISHVYIHTNQLKNTF